MPSSVSIDPKKTRGRLLIEDISPYRTDFQRDRDRIIHSTAFRRLKHKTQVFVANGGDYFRTRLTHSIEVGQIARTLAGALGLNIDLTEAISLAHDLGHAPFGHTGEEALNNCMSDYGGFDHNTQAIKVVTMLEKQYPDFDGLNLTWETLEGIAKHNGPLKKPISYYIRDYNARHDLELDRFASCEAQVAAIADDVAYNNHDLSDGLRAGLFSPKDLSILPVVGECFREVEKKYPNIENKRKWHESLRRLFDIMIEDILTQSRRNLNSLEKKDFNTVRSQDHSVINFSESLQKDVKEIKLFLFERMYRHWKVNRIRFRTSRLVEDMFEIFFANPELLPEEWGKIASGGDETHRARVIADYIAGMTDQYALMEYRKLSNDETFHF